MKVLLRLTWWRMAWSTPNSSSYIKVPPEFFFFCSGHVSQKLWPLLFWKFHWVWRDVGGPPQIIKKMKNFWKTLLDSSQCQNCIDKASWVSWRLVTWLRNYKLFYFRSFFQFGVMSDKRTELSAKWRTSGKLCKSLINAKSA